MGQSDSSVQEGGSTAVVHDPLPVGLVAVALIAGTAPLAGVQASLALSGAAFCGTAVVYGIDRGVAAAPEDHINRPGRVAWRRGRQGTLRFELIALIAGLLVALSFLQWTTIGVAALLGGLGVLHSVPLSPGGFRLKAIGGLKPLLIAGVWAVGAVCLPILESRASLSVSAVWLIAYRFAFVLPNVLLHDWSDREGDVAVGLRSWAAPWSLRGLRMVCTGLLASALAGALLHVVALGGSPLLLVDAVGVGAMIGAIWVLRPDDSPWAPFVLDLLVAWPIVTWGVSALGWL